MTSMATSDQCFLCLAFLTFTPTDVYPRYPLTNVLSSEDQIKHRVKFIKTVYNAKYSKIYGWMAERSKALVLGTSLFGGVGSNPTSIIFNASFLKASFNYLLRKMNEILDIYYCYSIYDFLFWYPKNCSHNSS